MKNNLSDFPLAQVLKLTEEEHFWLVFELGNEYLKHYCGGFFMDRQIYLELPEFWQWFKSIVMQADNCRYWQITIDYVESKEQSGVNLKDLYYRLIDSHDSLILTPNRVVCNAYNTKYKAIKPLLEREETLTKQPI